MDVPLEVILSMYKDHLGKTRFDRLEEYVTDFIRFLEGHSVLFPTEVQESFLRNMISERFERLKWPREAVSTDSGVASTDDPPIPEPLESKIDECIKSLSELKPLGGFSETFVSELLKQKKQLFDEVAESVFEKSQLSDPILGSLRELGGLITTRVLDPSISCGIAFVGYGEEDIFPHLIAFVADVIVDGRLRYREKLNVKMSRGQTANVISLGKDDMIRTFFEGVNRHESNSLIALRERVKSLIEDAQEDTVIGPIEVFVETLDSLINETQTRSQSMFNVIGSFPQADLAKTAQELVKLECLWQRLSEEQEVSGGPVDVALITKGGFAWVKHETIAEFVSNRPGTPESLDT
jgi:hypothetical protein